MAADDEIRIGNPERERAVRLLNDAFAAGYLEMDEFEERAGAVYVARTRGELAPLLADLPNGHALFGGPAPNPGPGHVTVPPEAVDIDWATVKRRGSWRVPAAMSVTGSMGTLVLDFTAARFTSTGLEVSFQVSVSTVKITLGPDHEICYSALGRTGWSSIKDKAGEPVRAGGPVITLTGAVTGASSVIVKRAS
ncbi:MAG: DUF1707 domain-containing protein [Gordonia sp. (in: high G+C Gram-positive bacteria)]|uniref:DUF1707 SHOCT-like domain-containing protein n=1 Tax=Gordonia sp. (in: high G+C Gram-positive bacteria) TaxID=84139 RepID=UPI0039E467F6